MNSNIMKFPHIKHKYQNYIAILNLNIFEWIRLDYLVSLHYSLGLDILVADFFSSSLGLKMVFLRERNMVTTFHL